VKVFISLKEIEQYTNLILIVYSQFLIDFSNITIYD